MSRLRPQPNEAVLRMYNVGLGDCFLLAFHGDPEPCYFVIDCGIAKNTSESKERMTAILEDLKEATGGTIDVLAITHEHYDHVSGFEFVGDLWKELKVEKLWVPWLEGGGKEAEELREMKKSLNVAVARAVTELNKLGVDVPPALEREDSFLAFDGLAAGEKPSLKGYATAMSLTKEHVHCEPGDVRRLPRTSVDAFVLGPPRYNDQNGEPLKEGGKFLLKLLEDHDEMYGYADIGQKADERISKKKKVSLNDSDLSMASALFGGSDLTDDRQHPFDRRYRLPIEVPAQDTSTPGASATTSTESAKTDPFFQENYYKTEKNDWRRIDGEWLESASEMALRAGDFTNNVSLVLAFKLPNSNRTLLFPGDAQVGNWLSWHKIIRWNPKDGAALPNPGFTAETILNSVIFYKVGHHGSHNATIKDRGLEMMGHGKHAQQKDMIAYVPVSVPIAHDVTGYCPMPFYPLMFRLQQVTKQNLFLSNGKRVEPHDDNVPPVNGVTIVHATKTLPDYTIKPMGEDKKKLAEEGEMPLYTDFIIDDSVLAD